MSVSSLGNRDCSRFSKLSFQEEIESRVAFRDLILAMIGFSVLCMSGVALGITSQDLIEFISTRFLLKF